MGLSADAGASTKGPLRALAVLLGSALHIQLWAASRALHSCQQGPRPSCQQGEQLRGSSAAIQVP